MKAKGKVIDLFRSMDTDYSATVDKEEFKQGLQQLGFDLAELLQHKLAPLPLRLDPADRKSMSMFTDDRASCAMQTAKKRTHLPSRRSRSPLTFASRALS